MAESSSPPTSQYFNLTYPLPYVAHVEINRPEKLNAFIEPMWLHLPRLFSHLSSSPSIRAIILSGAGPKAFTAGLDITAITSGPLSQSAPPPPSTTLKTTTLPPYSQPTGTPYTTQTPPPPPPTPTDPARLARSLLTHITTFQSSLTSLETCPKPIIAVLHGHCYGLGIDLSLCADLRICTPSAKFAVKEVDLGLAADVGTLTRLGKVTGNASWVKDVCISAREFDAQEALQFGFVSRVTSPASALPSASENTEAERQTKEKETAIYSALQWASTVASKSPIAVQGTKELLNWSRDHSVADGLRYTAVWNGAMLQTEDVGRAIRAGGVGKGKEKKKPRFEKL